MPSRFYVRLIQISILYSGIFGCAGESPLAPVPVTPTPVVGSIDVSPTALLVARGEDLQLQAVVKSTTGGVLEGRAVTWTNLTPTLLAVSGTGLVRGIAEGVATVRASHGGVSRDVNVVVGASPIASVAIPQGNLELVEGGDVLVQAEVRNGVGELLHLVAVEWQTDAAAVATVLGGRITAVAEGETTVRARVGDLEAEISVTVLPDFGGTLMFVRDAGTPVLRPSIYRADPRDFDASTEALVIPGDAWHPSVSAYGKMVFTCTASGPSICVANADGTGARVLTDGDLSYEDQPTWSPDGMQIAFRRWAQGATPGPFNPTDIWVMDADGSNQRNLTADDRSQSWPSWSPIAIDGITRIAFEQDSLVDGYETSRIFSINAFGNDRRAESDAGTWVDRRPSWSPDGRQIAFVRNGESFDNAILAVNLATREWFRFLFTPLPSGAQSSPVFSPSGRYLLFTSTHEVVNGASVAQVYSVRVDGRDVRRRSAGTEDVRDLAWVPAP